MAQTVEVNSDAEEAVVKTLTASGHIIEPSEPEPQTEKPKPAPSTEPEKKKEAGEVSEEPKKDEPATKAVTKEEIPKEEQDWDKLPTWAKQTITKLRDDKRDLRDKLQDERAARPTAPAGGQETAAKTGEEAEQGFTYSGVPEPTFEQFEKAEDPYREFTRAHSGWAKDEAVAQIRVEQQIRDQGDDERRVMALFDERQNETAKIIPDYADVLEEAVDLKASNAMQRVIYTSEVGPAILYHLAQNPAECKRIFALAPAAAIQAMGRLEAHVETVVKTLKAKPPTESPKKKPQPPEPETPLRGNEPKGKTLRDLAGPEDRHVDMVKFNPDYVRKREEQRRGR